MLLLSLLSCLSYSQNDLLKVKIVNSNNKIIPFANVVEVHRSFGVAADMHGVFILDEPKAVLDTCSLRISAMGYQDTIIPASRLHKYPVVTMKGAVIKLSEVSITNWEKKKYMLGVENRCKILCGGFNNVYINSQSGILIENDKGKPLKINEVKVYVKKEGKPEAPFRLRIYQYDTITDLPGKDILLQQKVKSAGKGGKWVEFDFVDEHIYIPESGAIVAVEWVLTKQKYYYQREEDKNYGVVLGVGYFDKQLVYKKNYKTGWWKGVFFENAKRFPAPAIRVYCSG